MKNTIILVVVSAVMLGMGSTFAATSYTDASGETINSAGGTIDFIGAEVSNTTTDLIISLKLDGDVNPLNAGGVDWGKFMVGIATTKSLGTTAGNGWSRPINMTAPGGYGMDYWIGAWVDGGGGSQLWNYSAGAWGQLAGSGNQQISNHAAGKSMLTYTLSMTTLGIGIGDTVYFDAYSSGGGGGDGAIDALANSSQSIANWGDSYTSSGSNLNSYTLIPEPSTPLLMGLGLAGLLALRRIQKA